MKEPNRAAIRQAAEAYAAVRVRELSPGELLTKILFPRPVVDLDALRAERVARAARRGLTIRLDMPTEGDV